MIRSFITFFVVFTGISLIIFGIFIIRFIYSEEFNQLVKREAIARLKERLWRGRGGRR